MRGLGLRQTGEAITDVEAGNEHAAVAWVIASGSLGREKKLVTWQPASDVSIA